MEIQIIVVLVLVLVMAALIIFSDEDWAHALSFILLLVVLVWGLVMLVFTVEVNRDIAVYSSQKAYIEQTLPDNEYENYAISQKKIEYNTWLYEAQYYKEKYGAWSLYPDIVLELEPIF